MLRENEEVCVGGIADTHTGRIEVNCHFLGGVIVEMLEFLLTRDTLPHMLKVFFIRNIYITATVVDIRDMVLSWIAETFVQLLSGTE